ALPAVDGRLNLTLQLAINRGFAEVALDPVDEELDALDRIHCLQQELLLLEREIDERRQKVRERVRPFARVHAQNVEQLVRILRIALDQLFEQRERLVHQVIGLGSLGDRTSRDLAKAAFEVRLVLQHLNELDALPSLQEQLISIGRQREALDDRREHADLRQILRPRILLIAALLTERGDQVLILAEALQQPDIAVNPHLERKHAARKEDRGDER